MAGALAGSGHVPDWVRGYFGNQIPGAALRARGATARQLLITEVRAALRAEAESLVFSLGSDPGARNNLFDLNWNTLTPRDTYLQAGERAQLLLDYVDNFLSEETIGYPWHGLLDAISEGQLPYVWHGRFDIRTDGRAYYEFISGASGEILDWNLRKPPPLRLAFPPKVIVSASGDAQQQLALFAQDYERRAHEALPNAWERMRTGFAGAESELEVNVQSRRGMTLPDPTDPNRTIEEVEMEMGFRWSHPATGDRAQITLRYTMRGDQIHEGDGWLDVVDRRAYGRSAAGDADQGLANSRWFRDNLTFLYRSQIKRLHTNAGYSHGGYFWPRLGLKVEHPASWIQSVPLSRMRSGLDRIHKRVELMADALPSAVAQQAGQDTFAAARALGLTREEIEAIEQFLIAHPDHVHAARLIPTPAGRHPFQVWIEIAGDSWTPTPEASADLGRLEASLNRVVNLATREHLDTGFLAATGTHPVRLLRPSATQQALTLGLHADEIATVRQALRDYPHLFTRALVVYREGTLPQVVFETLRDRLAVGRHENDEFFRLVDPVIASLGQRLSRMHLGGSPVEAMTPSVVRQFYLPRRHAVLHAADVADAFEAGVAEGMVGSVEQTVLHAADLGISAPQVRMIQDTLRLYRTQLLQARLVRVEAGSASHTSVVLQLRLNHAVGDLPLEWVENVERQLNTSLAGVARGLHMPPPRVVVSGFFPEDVPLGQVRILAAPEDDLLSGAATARVRTLIREQPDIESIALERRGGTGFTASVNLARPLDELNDSEINALRFEVHDLEIYEGGGNTSFFVTTVDFFDPGSHVAATPTRVLIGKHAEAVLVEAEEGLAHDLRALLARWHTLEDERHDLIRQGNVGFDHPILGRLRALVEGRQRPPGSRRLSEDREPHGQLRRLQRGVRVRGRGLSVGPGGVAEGRRQHDCEPHLGPVLARPGQPQGSHRQDRDDGHGCGRLLRPHRPAVHRARREAPALAVDADRGGPGRQGED